MGKLLFAAAALTLAVTGPACSVRPGGASQQGCECNVAARAGDTLAGTLSLLG